MSWPLVSVIIPNYNYGRYLKQAVDSALAQTYPAVEVIVADDGSQDDSVALLKSYGDRIKWLAQPRRDSATTPDRGPASARNRAVRESRGDYLAFLDADDYWLAGKLERQMEKYQHDPGLGMVYCGVEEFNDRGPLRQLQEGLEGKVTRDLLLGRPSAFFGGGSGFIAPRDLFEEVGGFDERLRISEDWDLAYQLATRRRVGFVPEVLVRYRVHQVNRHYNIGAMERDMMLVYAKAFEQAPPDVQELRRRCYGRLHMILAGSFFQAGQYSRFARHALKSLWLAPANSTRLFTYPIRCWQRRKSLLNG